MIIDGIIPVFKPGPGFIYTIKKLKRQSVPLRRLYVIVSWENVAETETRLLTEVCAEWDRVRVKCIPARKYDHAAVRDECMRSSDADYVLFMAQDATPGDRFMLCNLLRVFENTPDAAIVYGRHIPHEKASWLEKYAREYSYPKTPSVRRKKDAEGLGVSSFRCSNVCALYDRRRYIQGKGFGRKMICAEDMVAAWHALEKGYAIAYEPDATVIHSHIFNWTDLFRRFFDIGVAHAENRSIFRTGKTEESGKDFLYRAIRKLVGEKKIRYIPILLADSVCKWTGYKAGLHYKLIPNAVRKKITRNKYYWRKNK